MITLWLGELVRLEIGPWYGPLRIHRTVWSTTLSAGPLSILRWRTSPAARPQENTHAITQTNP